MPNRYKDQYGANDILMQGMDTGFLGVNTQLDPGLLKTGAAWSDVNQVLAGPGICSSAINMRFRRGIAETRAGTVMPVWCNPRNTDVIAAPDGCPWLYQSQNPNLHADRTGVLFQFETTLLWLARFDEDYDSHPLYSALTGAAINPANVVHEDGLWHFYQTIDAVETLIVSSTTDAAYPWLATWPDFTQAQESPWQDPWQERILAAAPFSDPDGRDYLLLVFPSCIYQTGDGFTPRRINLPDGIILQDPLELVQTFDSMVLLRGFDLPPLAWDGNSDSFATIPEADPNGSYTASIPPSSTGAVMSNRLLLVTGRDTIAVSDILDFTRYDDALNAFRINSGEDDEIAAIFPFRRTNLLVFKSESIHLISNVSGDLSVIAAEIVNSEIGCASPRSIAAVGGDVFFLSSSGVFKVSEVVELSMQVQEQPISEPIDSLIQRINWNAVAGAQAVVHGDYYRLAVPIDGATANNVVLVYDAVRGYWQGYDEYPDDFTPDLLGVARYLGRRCAYAIDRDRASVAMLDHGTTDAAREFGIPSLVDPYPAVVSGREITSIMQTRGYILLDDGPKRFRSGQVILETWNPSYTVSLVTDGINEEETVINSRTRDRTLWHLHGKAPYAEDNYQHNHAAPKRMDYSVALPDGGFHFDTGVALQLSQQQQEHFAIRRTGGWLAIKITNTQGTMAVKSAGVDGHARRNIRRVFA
jgi:hypothetical protein